MMAIRFLTFAMVLALTATESVEAAPQCFFGKDSFTIESKLSGTQSGTLVEHVRKCGAERVEIREAVTSMMGFTTKQSQRTIYRGAEIITIDSQTGNVTKTRNPMYDDVVKGMEEKSGVEYGKQMMRSMGGSPTGDTKTVANQKCEVWTLPQMGSTMCIAAWGGTLQVDVDMAGMKNGQVATAVRVGDPGPAEAYAFDPAKLQEPPTIPQGLPPDLQKMLEGVLGGQSN